MGKTFTPAMIAASVLLLASCAGADNGEMSAKAADMWTAEISERAEDDIADIMPLVSADDCETETVKYIGFSMERNYMADMIRCCAAGDVEGGRTLASERMRKQDAAGDVSPRVSFDDLYLLAKVIHNEAGSSWLSMEWKMKVGEVLLNRVESPEFPNTLVECVYQKGQYAGVTSQRFAEMRPDAASAEAAARLLNGERLMDEPSVVFQANYRLGGGVHETMYDTVLGRTYLCYSSYRHIYE